MASKLNDYNSRIEKIINRQQKYKQMNDKFAEQKQMKMEQQLHMNLHENRFDRKKHPGVPDLKPTFLSLEHKQLRNHMQNRKVTETDQVVTKLKSCSQSPEKAKIKSEFPLNVGQS